MSANKKKIIVLCTMVLLLVVTGVLNFFIGQKLPSGDPNDGNTVTTFFASHRTNRESARAEEIAYLDAIISSEASSEAAKTEAEAQKQLLCKNIETELVLEGLIKAHGFENVIVTMSTSNCNVIIKSDELTKEQVGQVKGIITEETDYLPTQLVIVSYNK